MGTPEDVAAEKFYTPPELEVNKRVIHHWERRIHYGASISCNSAYCPNKIKDKEYFYLELYPDGHVMVWCVPCAAFQLSLALDELLSVFADKELDG